MLKLIVFDCDGVLFDSRRANEEYYNHLLRHFNHPPMSEEELEYVHMHNALDAIRHIFRHYPQDSPEEIDAFRREQGYEHVLPYMIMEEDLLQFLEKIRGRYHLAISTNRGNTMIPLLKTFKLEGYFAKVVTAETARRPKPAPDGLEEILEHFDCSPKEALFIGDSIIDARHAAASFVPLVAFKNPSLPADYHVSSFMEVLDLPPLQQRS